MKIAYISLYCYKSFPVRIFHSLSIREGVDSHAIFFKNSSANNHTLVTEKEIRLLLNVVKNIKPDLIAMSILAPYVVVAKKLIHNLRKEYDVPIIAGGKYPTISPEKALEFADYVCRGEGELIIRKIIEHMEKGLDLSNIKGLWYKNEDGEVVDQGQQVLIQDLDEIPFPAIGDPQMYFIENNLLSERDPELTDPLIWVMSGRGCVYQCSFCINSLLAPMNKGNGKFVRQRSPNNVIEEIEYRLKKHKHPEQVFFVDEVFGTSFNWTKEFCEKYIERVGLPFFCELIPKLINEENIKLLADAGLYELDFGIQSGSDRIRNEVMNRPGTNKEMLQKVDILKKYKVNPRYDLILRNPFDTVEILEETIDLLLQLPSPKYFNIFKMQFFPHYPFTMQALKEGFITEDDLTDENLEHSVFRSWTFVPKVFSVNRNDYLESCIYLVAWNSYLGQKIAIYLRRRENRLLGFVANILAIFKYFLLFRCPTWLRNFLSGSKLLLSGNIKTLVFKIKRRIVVR
ncbi:MAG: radical SAM protein [Candidatus Brocadiales bacterium]|nr:radical SAM protein [Candidatus Brocadiales bacterium]